MSNGYFILSRLHHIEWDTRTQSKDCAGFSMDNSPWCTTLALSRREGRSRDTTSKPRGPLNHCTCFYTTKWQAGVTLGFQESSC